VISVTRTGNRPAVSGVVPVAADASDPTRLTEITAGAHALYNCANPSHYGNWEKVWPPLWSSMLRTAEATGAVLVSASSLYAYGPVDAVMTEQLPDKATEKNGRIRAAMWAEAKQLHDQGRIRAVEVRASDYAGAGVGGNGHLTRNVPAALAGRPVWFMGDPDQPHSWTDVLDVGRALATVAEHPGAYGRVWLAPTNPPRSAREATADVLAEAGRPMVAMRRIPDVFVRAAGLVNADFRQFGVMSYIMKRPYVIDSSAITAAFGLAPTPWGEVCRRTAGLSTVAAD
jgi:nucleoside-diphosphate-sugar epimerase